MCENLKKYENLLKIGLEDYLNEAFKSVVWSFEPWLNKLDEFVGKISENDLDILKEKINNPLGHFQKNDIVNEIMIACTYHPKANFVREGNVSRPDLYDNQQKTYIEVKSLNVGKDEMERYKIMDENNNVFTNISPILTESEEDKIRNKNKIKSSIEKKVLDHFTKASSQLNDKGKIYLVYDYNLFHDLRHFNLFPKECVLQAIIKCIDDFLRYHTNIRIQAIYFADLREKILENHKDIL